MKYLHPIETFLLKRILIAFDQNPTDQVIKLSSDSDIGYRCLDPDTILKFLPLEILTCLNNLEETRRIEILYVEGNQVLVDMMRHANLLDTETNNHISWSHYYDFQREFGSFLKGPSPLVQVVIEKDPYNVSISDVAAEYKKKSPDEVTFVIDASSSSRKQLQTFFDKYIQLYLQEKIETDERQIINPFSYSKIRTEAIDHFRTIQATHDLKNFDLKRNFLFSVESGIARSGDLYERDQAAIPFHEVVCAMEAEGIIKIRDIRYNHIHGEILNGIPDFSLVYDDVRAKLFLQREETPKEPKDSILLKLFQEKSQTRIFCETLFAKLPNEVEFDTFSKALHSEGYNTVEVNREWVTNQLDLAKIKRTLREFITLQKGTIIIRKFLSKADLNNAQIVEIENLFLKDKSII